MADANLAKVEMRFGQETDADIPGNLDRRTHKLRQPLGNAAALRAPVDEIRSRERRRQCDDQQDRKTGQNIAQQISTR